MKYDPLAAEYNRDYQLGMPAGMPAANQQHNQEERRFTAAVAAMQGIVTRPDTKDDTDICWCVRTSVEYADALLKELEK